MVSPTRDRAKPFMLITRASATSLNNIRRAGLANGDSTGANCRFASRDMRTLRERELSTLTASFTRRIAFCRARFLTRVLLFIFRIIFFFILLWLAVALGRTRLFYP